MKLAANFEKLLYRADGSAEVTFSTVERTEAEKLKGMSDGLLDVRVEPHKEKRTYRANAYFWKLANELANKLSVHGSKPVSAEMVYLQYVRDFGRSDLYYMKSAAVTIFCEAWERQGMGWIAIPQQPNPNRKSDMREVQVFYGSSVYTKEEMARLIEAVVADCKEQGIETKTPDEIAEMMSLMEDYA